jgi:hypothetical protein
MQDDVESIRISGRVCDGRGDATSGIGRLSSEIHEKTGIIPYPGSLNVILDHPIQLSSKTAIKFASQGRSRLWRLQLVGAEDIVAYGYRWKGCPLHVLEIISDRRLRNHLSADCVDLELRRSQISPLAWYTRLAHGWLWERYTWNWYYTDDIRPNANLRNKIKKFFRARQD